MDSNAYFKMGASKHFEFLTKLDNELTHEDREKIRILLMDKNLETPISLNAVIMNRSANNIKLFLSEILYLILRYDLLKCLNVCEVTVNKRLSSSTSYFDEKSNLLLKIYNQITVPMESEFNKQFEIVRWQWFRPDLNQKINSYNCFSLAQRILLCVYNDLNFLHDIFKSLRWNSLVDDALNFKELWVKDSLWNKGFYPMDKSPCGRCIIINNFNISNQLPRRGSKIDEEKIIETFTNFDFLVESHNDLDEVPMINCLKAIAGDDHSQFCAFVCCIMSHGLKGGIKSSDDNLIMIEDIIDIFNDQACPSLAGKPKLFIIQACQGESLQLASNHIEMDGPNVSLVHKTKDYVLGLATLEGCGAIRDPTLGSWFIQALAKAFEEFDDIDDVMLKVVRLVGSQVTSVGINLGSQTPIWKQTTSKKLKFRRKQ